MYLTEASLHGVSNTHHERVEQTKMYRALPIYHVQNALSSWNQFALIY